LIQEKHIVVSLTSHPPTQQLRNVE